MRDQWSSDRQYGIMSFCHVKGIRVIVLHLLFRNWTNMSFLEIWESTYDDSINVHEIGFHHTMVTSSKMFSKSVLTIVNSSKIFFMSVNTIVTSS